MSFVARSTQRTGSTLWSLGSSSASLAENPGSLIYDRAFGALFIIALKQQKVAVLIILIFMACPPLA